MHPQPGAFIFTQDKVHGFRNYKGPRLIKKIKPGNALTLSAEPTNPHDEFAVEIFYKTHKIGYVPMSDNRHISRLLQQNMKLHCTVAEVHPTMQTWEMLKVEVFFGEPMVMHNFKMGICNYIAAVKIQG